MRAVVTGGAGFIGSHIAEALLSEGTEVLVIDNLSTGREQNLKSIAGELKFEKLDIQDSKVLDLFKKFSPDIIFHTAAQVNVRRSVAEPVVDCGTNVVGTVNLLDAARESGARGLIFSSTGGAVYGEQDYFPADEGHPSDPDSPYGVGKHAAELYLKHYSKVHGMLNVSLRYANVFGPRQNPKGEAGVVAVFTDRLLAGQPLVVNGDGEQTRDFVFVMDVVKANLLTRDSILDSAAHAGKSRVYNVGTETESSVLDVVGMFREIWSGELKEDDRRREFEVTHGPALPGEQRRSVVATTLIQKELGWKTDTDLKSGLRKTIRSFLSEECKS